jgi:hypothetical protein
MAMRLCASNDCPTMRPNDAICDNTVHSEAKTERLPSASREFSFQTPLWPSCLPANANETGRREGVPAGRARRRRTLAWSG